MAEEAREDAVVIPIGTGGRPGRGTGSARPSSAARNLSASRKPAPAQKKKTKAAPPRKKAAPPSGPTPTEQPAASAPSGDAPTTGIPVGDWIAALQGAAHEVLGDDWERRAAELMAFARRRLEGDYEVDDYGFER